MTLCQPEVDNESSSLVQEMMIAARAKAGKATSSANTITDETILLPNPETMDFNERADAAIAKSSALIAEALAQLTALKVAPKELTLEEKVEARRNLAWDRTTQKKDREIDAAMKRNDQLFEEVMAMIDEMEANGDPIPDCSDLLTWTSNAGQAGTKASSTPPARWSQGLKVLGLVVSSGG